MAGPETRGETGAFSFGAFRADPRSGELTKHGIRIKLQEKPFQILLYFLAHPSEVVTREDLRIGIWGRDTYLDFDHSLNIAMNKLREALCDSADEPRYVETLPRRGYRFIAEVSSNGHSAPAQSAPVSPAAEAPAAQTLALPPEAVEPRRQVRFVWLWSSAAGLSALALATLLAFRYISAPKTPTLSFHARDWVLITHFENRTGEPILEGTVSAALSRDLTNSQFVTVVPRERVNDTLALMRLPASTMVDAAIGREVCLRDGGIRVLISGRVEKVGSAYILSAQLVEPASGRAVESVEEDADSQAGILRSVHALSGDVRQALGQKVSEIQKSDLELQKVTTPSLRALQLYSRADQQIRDGDHPAAFELLQSAIKEDPNFASAYILAAYALAKQSKPQAEFMPYAKEALELSNQASDAERYFIEGSYYEMIQEDDKAVPAYEALLKVDPGHFWGLNNLEGLYAELNQQYASQNRMQELVDLSVRHAEIEPNNFNANFAAGSALLLVSEQPDLARPYFVRANELLLVMDDRDRRNFVWEALWLQLYPAYQAWMMDDVGLARADLERAERNPAARDGIADPLIFAAFRQALGETHKAKEWLMKAVPPPDEMGALDLAILTILGGDHTKTRFWLERIERNENEPRIVSPMAISLFVREGMVHQANSLAQKYNKWRPQFRNVAMGELMLARGKTLSATRLLRDGVNEERDHAYPTYFLGAESLARAYEKSGNFPAALETLESTSPERVRVNGPFGMSTAGLWMRDQMDLARLYRRLGRAEDAQKIEGELRALLAYADTDYPLVVELKRLQSIP